MMKRYCFIWILCMMLTLTSCGNQEPVAETICATETIPEPTVCVPTEPEPTEPLVFSEDITFSGDYIADGTHMPYALFTPSSAQPDVKIPMIVFLHGRGECNTDVSWFMNIGMPQVMNNWKLTGFNAYVVCPQLYGRWNTGHWYSSDAAEYVMELLDYLVGAYPVDTENVVLVGFSAGGMGALYMVEENPDYFSKLVVMSAPDSGAGSLENIAIPTVGCSEMEISYNSFMNDAFPKAFGADSVRYYCVKHIEVPHAAFNDDADNDQRSDLVEWMFEES